MTLVSPTVEGTLVDKEHKYATHGLWLQVLLDEDFIDKLADQLDFLSDMSQVSVIVLLKINLKL